MATELEFLDLLMNQGNATGLPGGQDQMTIESLLQQALNTQPEPIGVGRRLGLGLADALQTYASLVRGGGIPPSSLDALYRRRQGEADRRRQALFAQAVLQERREARTQERQEELTDRERTRREKVTEREQATREELEMKAWARRLDPEIIESASNAELARMINEAETITDLRKEARELGLSPPRTGTDVTLERMITAENRRRADKRDEPKPTANDRERLRDVMTSMMQDAFGFTNEQGVQVPGLAEQLRAGTITPEDAERRFLLAIRTQALPIELHDEAVKMFNDVLLPIIEEFERGQQQRQFTQQTVPELFQQQPLGERAGEGFNRFAEGLDRILLGQ